MPGVYMINSPLVLTLLPEQVFLPVVQPGAIRLLSELLWTKDEFPEKQGLFYYQKVKSKYHT